MTSRETQVGMLVLLVFEPPTAITTPLEANTLSALVPALLMINISPNRVAPPTVGRLTPLVPSESVTEMNLCPFLMTVPEAKAEPADETEMVPVPPLAV
jgi:hypothetical protein